MYKKILSITLLLFLLATPLANAQDSDNPTIAILRYGPFPTYALAAHAILDTLQAHDFISAEERAMLSGQQDLAGEKVNIIWGDANFDPANAALLVNTVVDQGADAIVAMMMPVVQAAVNVTSELENPPIILFTSGYNPYDSGVAQSSCIKPANLSGSEPIINFAEFMPLLLLQDPDLQTLGLLYSTPEASGVVGAETMGALATEMGLTVERAAITSVADIRAATEGLINKGAQAIVASSDTAIALGFPIVVEVGNEHDVPVYHPSLSTIVSGATVGAGYYNFYEQGIAVGRMLVGHLNGDIDIAKTAIHGQTGFAIGVNVDSIKEQGKTANPELLEMADVIIEDGTYQKVNPIAMLGFVDPILLDALGSPDIGVAELGAIGDKAIADGEDYLPEPIAALYMQLLSSDERKAADMAFLESLHCSDEIIAEQQAALDAADG